jgi:hypothetical protein
VSAIEESSKTLVLALEVFCGAKEALSLTLLKISKLFLNIFS